MDKESSHSRFQESNSDELIQNSQIIIQLISEVKDRKALNQTSVGVQSYSLKCIKDPFANQFLYIPTHADGVVIGSTLNKPANKALWSFDKLNLAQEHCLLQYLSDQMLYIVQDLSHQYQQQYSTWVSAPNLVASDQDWLNLHDSNNFDREFRIVQDKVIVQMNFTQDFKQSITSLKQWCVKHDLQDFALLPIFDKMGVKTIHDLSNFDISQFKKILQQIFSEKDNQKYFESFLKVYDKHRPKTQTNGNNPNILYLNIKPSPYSEVMQIKLDGTKTTIVTSADHVDSSKSSLVLEYPGLSGFKMALEYDEQAVGIQLKTYTNWTFEDNMPCLLYKLNSNDVVAVQPGMIIQLNEANFLIERFNLGVVCKIGNRTCMEDNYIIAQDLGLNCVLKASFFAVLDGHGGSVCSNYLQQSMVRELNLELQNQLIQNTHEFVGDYFGNVVEKIFVNLYSRLDFEFYKKYQQQAQTAGAVCCGLFIVGNNIFSINLGDCRAILSRNGQAIDLSQDHKTTLQSEINRVKLEGGQIVGGRVQNKLSVTRAFGDFQFKIHYDENGNTFFKDYLSCKPEIRTVEMDPKLDEFIIIASDGVTDVMTSQFCVDFVHQERTKTQNFKNIANRLANKAIKDLKTKDNVTVMIIALNRINN